MKFLSKIKFFCSNVRNKVTESRSNVITRRDIDIKICSYIVCFMQNSTDRISPIKPRGSYSYN